MNKTFRTALAVALSLSSFGCSLVNSKSPSIVKDGFLTNHKGTTVGRAFDTYFAAPNWVMLKTENGTQYVEFTGHLKKEYAPLTVGTKVLMQFIIYNDKSFNISCAGFCELPSKVMQDLQTDGTRGRLAEMARRGSATSAILVHLNPSQSNETALMLDYDGMEIFLNEIYRG